MKQHLCEICEFGNVEIATFNRYVFGNMVKTRKLIFFCNHYFKNIQKYCVVCPCFQIKSGKQLKVTQRGKLMNVYQKILGEK